MAAATDLKPRAQWTVIDIRPCGPKCENSTGIESGPSARIRFAKKPASFSSIKWQISEPEYPGSTVRWTVDTPSMPATAFLCVAASPLPREQAKIPNVRNWTVRDYGNRVCIWPADGGVAIAFTRAYVRLCWSIPGISTSCGAAQGPKVRGLFSGRDRIRTPCPSCERVSVSGRNRKAGLGEEDDLKSVVYSGSREFAPRSLQW